MKTLKLFYKEEIKTLASNIKTQKPLNKKIQSMINKGLKDTESFKSLCELSVCNLSYSKAKVRHLYLAYALIRGKDPQKAEANYPEGHDVKWLRSLMEEMDKSYNLTLQEKTEV